MQVHWAQVNFPKLFLLNQISPRYKTWLDLLLVCASLYGHEFHIQFTVACIWKKAININTIGLFNTSAAYLGYSKRVILLLLLLLLFLIYYNILNVSIILWSSMSGIPNKGSWYWHFMLPFNYCMKCLEQRHGLQLSIKAVPIPILAASNSLAITASKAFVNVFHACNSS